MKTWWVSWYEREGCDGSFDYDGPWWVSGCRVSDEASSVVALVLADSENSAKRVIEAAHDDAATIVEWRFASEKPDGWEPFCDRFQRADWMRWPWPE